MTTSINRFSESQYQLLPVRASNQILAQNTSESGQLSPRRHTELFNRINGLLNTIMKDLSLSSEVINQRIEAHQDSCHSIQRNMMELAQRVNEASIEEFENELHRANEITSLFYTMYEFSLQMTQSTIQLCSNSPNIADHSRAIESIYSQIRSQNELLRDQLAIKGQQEEHSLAIRQAELRVLSQIAHMGPSARTTANMQSNCYHEIGEVNRDTFKKSDIQPYNMNRRALFGSSETSNFRAKLLSDGKIKFANPPTLRQIVSAANYFKSQLKKEKHITLCFHSTEGYSVSYMRTRDNPGSENDPGSWMMFWFKRV